MPTPVRVSVIIPAYYSEETLLPSLATMVRQSYDPVEIIVVDSTPHAPSADAVKSAYPDVHFHHSPVRLMPHAARNVGVSLAQGELLLFSDPDVYAEPDWIERLVETHDATAHLVCSGITCHGTQWVHLGMHYSKLDQWLPGGRPRFVEIGPTYGLLCPRSVFDALGGFTPQHMLSDAEFSWRAVQAGYRIWFYPAALLEHHHVGTWRGLVVSMRERGQEYSGLRIKNSDWTRLRILLHLLLTLSTLRLFSLCWRILRNAARAGQIVYALWTLPIIVSAQGAWLLGEAEVYVKRLFSPG